VEGIALNHPFQDGNTRTATIVGTTFLAANGAIIASSGDELGQQVEALVITRNTSAFLAWVKKHLVIQ
jgi:prophage maintenance system killer protein